MFEFLSTDELRSFIWDQSRVLNRHTKGVAEAAFQDWAVAVATANHNAKIELSRRQLPPERRAA